jgi:protein-S-isoprenylcysteine O-methyltransferase Ste14
MLGGVISFRVYIAVGVVVGIIVYLVGLLAGSSLAQFFIEIQNNALANGISPAIVTLIVGPFIFALSNPAIGGIIAGFVWPLIIVWLVLLFLIIIVTAFSQGYNTAASGTDQFNQ